MIIQNGNIFLPRGTFCFGTLYTLNGRIERVDSADGKEPYGTERHDSVEHGLRYFFRYIGGTKRRGK